MDLDYLKKNHIIHENRRRSNSIGPQKKQPNYFSKSSGSLSGETDFSKNIEDKNDNTGNKNKYSKIRNTQRKKRVKFNEHVEVIMVKSYKKYNKEDNYSYINNSKQKNKRREDIKCNCNII